MVMGGDSFSEGCGFESEHRSLDGHFSRKNCYVSKYKNKRKRGWVWPIFFKKK